MKTDIETMNKKQLEVKNAISEMKNTLEGIKRRLDEAEDRISDLKNKVEANTQSEQQKEKRLKKNEDGLTEIWNNVKHNNICIIKIPEGEESEQGIENLFEEIMTENFTNLVKENVTEVQEAERVPIRGTQRDPHQDTS